MLKYIMSDLIENYLKNMTKYTKISKFVRRKVF